MAVPTTERPNPTNASAATRRHAKAVATCAFLTLIDLPSKETDVDEFTKGYIDSMLWAEVISRDADDETYDTSFTDANYDETDLAPTALAQIVETCKDFQESNAADLLLYADERSMSHAGHDFWLTRNGHGAGFWDRGLGALGNRLTAAAKIYGSADPYLGDDGLIYVE